LLRDLGTKLGPKERCGVYLTNALTGWEPPKGAKETLGFQFLQEEQDAASKVKRDTPILVILGNPPYNALAGVAQDEEADLIAPYKAGLGQVWNVKKQLLDDLYVRFFRLGERQIAEAGAHGIVSLISNSSWLDGLSHPIMRSQIIERFDHVWIDNCNGDRFRTGKLTPDGFPDQSMFTTDSQVVGIQVGIAIATLLRRTGGARQTEVRYRDLWGLANTKRAELAKTLTVEDPDALYTAFTPRADQRWVLQPITSDSSWMSWWSLPNIFNETFKGVQPHRGGSLISIDPNPLKLRMRAYFDSDKSDIEVREISPELMAEEARYEATEVRRKLLASGAQFDEKQVIPIAWLPFDDRWLYWQGKGKLLNEKRTEFKEQVWNGNLFMACTQKPRKGEFSPPVITAHIGSNYVFDPYATYFPLTLRHEFLGEKGDGSNVNSALLSSLDASEAAAAKTASGVFHHSVAVMWSPEYRRVNGSALRQDWPRVPIPADAALLAASAALGRTVADLLLPDKDVPGVTKGTIRPEFRTLAIPTKADGTNIEEGDDTKVTAGWGFHGQKNAVMCGKGGVTLTASDPENAVDIWINDTVYWANVPKPVWAMTIGGYPVVKKWLSYREHKVLGRPLKTDELFYITQVVRRLAALLAMGAELDANYRACAAAEQVKATAAT